MAAILPDIDDDLAADNASGRMVENIPSFEYLVDQEAVLVHISQLNRGGQVGLLRVNFLQVVLAQYSVLVALTHLQQHLDIIDVPWSPEADCLLYGLLKLRDFILFQYDQPKVVLVFVNSPDGRCKLLGRHEQHQLSMEVEVLLLLNFCTSEFVVVVHHHQETLAHNYAISLGIFIGGAGTIGEYVHLLLHLSDALLRIQQQHTSVLLRDTVLADLIQLWMRTRHQNIVDILRLARSQYIADGLCRHIGC